MKLNKNRFSPKLKKQKINKEVIDQIRDTKRRMKEKIINAKSKD